MLRPQSPSTYAAQARAASSDAEARELRNEVASLRRQLAEARAQTEMLAEAAVEESGGNAVGTNGLTLAGYTNNLDREIQLVINKWALHYAPLSKECHRDRYCTYYLSEGQAFARSRLSVEHKKDINLRVLVRMEWFDWCMHSHVLGKALLDLANLTDRGVAPDLAKTLASKLRVKGLSYFKRYQKAMKYEHSETMRKEFENARYRYWRREGNIQFEQDPKDGVWFPSTKATLAANPEARFDLHLPAGQIAAEFGISIETWKPTKRYRNSMAGNIAGGSGAGNSGGWFI